MAEFDPALVKDAIRAALADERRYWLDPEDASDITVSILTAAAPHLRAEGAVQAVQELNKIQKSPAQNAAFRRGVIEGARKILETVEKAMKEWDGEPSMQAAHFLFSARNEFERIEEGSL